MDGSRRQDVPSDVWVIPEEVAMKIAIALEWIYYIASFGRKRPEVFNREMVDYCCYT